MDHSIYGPSSAARWIACPGSIKACEGLPDLESSYADEGRMAHKLAEIALNSGKSCADYIGMIVDDNVLETVDEEMAEYVQIYVDYIRGIDGRHEYEVMVNYDEWVPEGFGTADAIVVDEDVIHVIDLKYGKGVMVDAYNNPQGKLYALGALSERSFNKFEQVIIHIVQPRLYNISRWETSPEELYIWGESLVGLVELTKQPNAPRHAGNHCKFCKAKPICAALSIKTESALMSEFDEFASRPREVSSLNDNELAFVLTQKPMIVDWLNSVEKYVTDKLKAGESFPGFKLVHGRSNRRWIDEIETEKVLSELFGECAYTKKLLTITQAEKALGKEKKKIANLIMKPEGALTLVPEKDKREAAQITIEQFNF
jgi:hypothetical protein